MATFLCSVAALAALLQAPSAPPPSPSDSLAALRERVARDSLDGAGWLLVGRGYLQLAEEAHGRAHRAEADSGWARAALDTAEAALVRAAAGPTGARPEARAPQRGRRLAGGARETAPRVRQHGVRAAARCTPAGGLGAPLARVGRRAARQGAGGAGARLRVRRAAGGSRRARPLGRSRPRRVHAGGATDARAVRAARDVQSGCGGAGVSTLRGVSTVISCQSSETDT